MGQSNTTTSGKHTTLGVDKIPFTCLSSHNYSLSSFLSERSLTSSSRPRRWLWWIDGVSAWHARISRPFQLLTRPWPKSARPQRAQQFMLIPHLALPSTATITSPDISRFTEPRKITLMTRTTLTVTQIPACHSRFSNATLTATSFPATNRLDILDLAHQRAPRNGGACDLHREHNDTGTPPPASASIPPRILANHRSVHPGHHHSSIESCTCRR